MSTRIVLLLASATIVLLISFLLVEKYQECRAARPVKECPDLGPYVSKGAHLPAELFKNP